MPMRETYTVTIQSLVYEGYGLSHLPDGKAVFVPFVMPKEEVAIRILEEKKHHAMAELIAVEKPHPKRITPRCIHFGNCGGCHYQHIPYDLQIEFKNAIFLEQLERIGHFKPAKIEPLIPSVEMWNYRNAIQFHLSTEGKLCFMDLYWNQPFEVRECHLPMQLINQVWQKVQIESGEGVSRVEFRQNHDEDLIIIIYGHRGQVPEIETEATISIVHVDGDDQLVLAGDNHLIQEIAGRQFRVSAGSFFQTNLNSAMALASAVTEVVANSGAKKILDIYCGVGLFSAFLAGCAEKLIGIESSRAACDDFAVNLDEFDHVSLYQGKAGQTLPLLEERPDCVITDPPRTGLKKEALQGILKLSPELLVYVSCNPSTLARDGKYLIKGGYELESSQVIDMFPQTYHIESVNVFRKSC